MLDFKPGNNKSNESYAERIRETRRAYIFLKKPGKCDKYFILYNFIKKKAYKVNIIYIVLLFQVIIW